MPDAITENNFPSLASGDLPCDPEDCTMVFCSSQDHEPLCPFFLRVKLNIWIDHQRMQNGLWSWPKLRVLYITMITNETNTKDSYITV